MCAKPHSEKESNTSRFMCHDKNQTKDENFCSFYILTVIDLDGQTKPYNITSEGFLAKVDEITFFTPPPFQGLKSILYNETQFKQIKRGVKSKTTDDLERSDNASFSP